MSWIPPTIHNFPPFFTKQPTVDTWKKQQQLWCEVIISYSQSNRIFTFDVTEMLKSPLFSNNKINRSLNRDVVIEILDLLVAQGHAEWESKQKQRCLIWWRKPDEWASKILTWASETAQNICTAFEIMQGDSTEGQEFHGMDEVALKKVLDCIVRQGKGQIFYGSSDIDMGIKFI